MTRNDHLAAAIDASIMAAGAAKAPDATVEAQTEASRAAKFVAGVAGLLKSLGEVPVGLEAAAQPDNDVAATVARIVAA